MHTFKVVPSIASMENGVLAKSCETRIHCFELKMIMDRRECPKYNYISQIKEEVNGLVSREASKCYQGITRLPLHLCKYTMRIRIRYL